MRSKLFNSNNILITENINEVLFNLDTFKIKNRLLDGTYHVQIIGSSTKQIDIECLVDESGKSIINNIEAYGAPITLEREGKRYTGLVDGTPQCKTIVKGTSNYRMYSCTFKLIVNQEGDA